MASKQQATIDPDGPGPDGPGEIADAEAYAEAVAQRVVTPAPTPLQPPDNPQQPYHLGVWGGEPRYQCKWCAFDSLDQDLLWEHFIGRHAADEKKPYQARVTVHGQPYGKGV